MNSVVASTSGDGGIVIDANGIGAATPPPASTIVGGTGINVDIVVPTSCLDAGVSDTCGVAS